MTDVWVSSDLEIWDYDQFDDFIWYPEGDLGASWRFISLFDVCNPAYGKINSGELEHTKVNDNNKFILDEFNYTPGFCYTFEHRDLPDSTSNYTLRFTGTYGGADDHIVEFQAYDWDSTSYTTFYTLPTSLFTEDHYLSLPSGSQYFQSSPGITNALKIRVIHTNFGNSGHLLRINYWYLQYS